MTEETAAKSVPGRAASVVIARLGAQGDGVVEATGVPVYVPFALPGETWTVDAAEGARRILAAGPHAERVTPACRHFGSCGGCVAQHMSPRLYADWKRGIVAEAFRQRGLEVDVAPLHLIAPHSRRRATFTARRVGDATIFGYHARATHDVCDVQVCPVLSPLIEAALPALRTICGRLLPQAGKSRHGPDSRDVRVVVTLVRAGLDVAITGAARSISASARKDVVADAQRADIQRLTIDGEPWLAGRAPVVLLGEYEVELPDQAFLQAVPEAEEALVRLVVEGVGDRFAKSSVIADLFCGLGTFTFALARKARVLALDGDKAAIAALNAAARHAQGVKPIEGRWRDLFREPLAERELSHVEAAVLDPPRSGAAAQVASLAAAKVPRVVMVSCNPATLARDCRTLVDGGFRLGLVTPVDQFLYSAHVEAVAVLTR